MTTQTEARAPYLSVSVQLDVTARIDGKDVHCVSWSAIRYPGQPILFTCYAHHNPELSERLTVLLRTTSLANPDVPVWVPRPPSGWLASLRMTEPDPVAIVSAALDAGESIDQYHERTEAVRARMAKRIGGQF